MLFKIEVLNLYHFGIPDKIVTILKKHVHLIYIRLIFISLGWSECLLHFFLLPMWVEDAIPHVTEIYNIYKYSRQHISIRFVCVL